MIPSDWKGTDSPLTSHIEKLNSQCLASYKENPLLVEEHTNIELVTAQGGYGKRQIYELIQNGADALIHGDGGRIEVIFTGDTLYCANQGACFDTRGVESITKAFISIKRGDEIGRWGLGFKSVLGITTQPQIFSQSASFEFNADKAADCIAAIVPKMNRYPVLRIAFPLDPGKASRADDQLAELMTWADTVVKLPVNVPDVGWLGNGVTQFPSEFLLFSPHVGKLILEDRVQAIRKEVTVDHEADLISIRSGDVTSTWKMTSFSFNPSEAALKDAGEIAKRDVVRLHWAIPWKDQAASSIDEGKFWAFFPTSTQMKLSGILNAPWKTSEDRQNLLEGRFNSELIDIFTGYVAENLAVIVNKEDPAAYLDLLPGRLAEWLNWGDDRLNKKVYESIAEKPCLPDMKGILRHPSEIKVHPENIPQEALEIWRQYPDHPIDWIHHDADTTNRRPRAERLMEHNGVKTSTLQEWLEVIANARTPDASIAALSVAAKIVNSPNPQKEEIQKANILLDSENNLVKPLPNTIFLPKSEASLIPDIRFVHPDVACSEEAKEALSSFGIFDAEVSSRLQAFLAECDPESMKNEDWDQFWHLVTNTPKDKSVSIVKQRFGDTVASAVKVKTYAESYYPINQTLLPGKVVPEDASRDADVGINMDFHKTHKEVLAEFGATDIPISNGSRTDESWFNKYLKEGRQLYYRSFGKSQWEARGMSKPKEEHLVFDETITTGPLLPLRRLGEEGRAIYTDLLLRAAITEGRWKLHHNAKRYQYPTLEVDSPCVWMAHREGLLETSLGIKPISECFGPQLKEWSNIMPVVCCSEEAARLVNLLASFEIIREEQRQKLFSVAAEIEDFEYLGKFYAAICEFVDKPEYIRYTRNNSLLLLKPSKICIISDTKFCGVLKDLSIPYLLVEDKESADRLIKHWGMPPGDNAAKVELVFTVSGPQIPITDRYLGLSPKLKENQESFMLVPCDDLYKKITTDSGTTRSECVIAQEGNLVYFLDQLSNDELLDQLTNLLRVSITEEERSRILENRALAEQRERTLRTRQKTDIAEKLLEAVGPESIRRKLPQGLIETIRGDHPDFDKDDKLASQLLLAIYGIDSLKIFRDELRSSGFQPPYQWAGSSTALRFVKLLGFPEEYAGFRQTTPEEVLEIEGPPDLKPLHQFQKDIVTNIQNLLKADSNKRGLLSLPTGAGKTRVVVESIIRSIREEGFTGPVLWVAQSEELCEQAVQTWSEVWRSMGSRDLLHINRLWTSNQAEYFGEGVQVVVATIDKLQGCTKNPDYNWLSQPTCLIIDEAHGSITQEYTNLFRWSGLERSKDIRPVIGLTATPYRTGETESQTLVRRFFGNRLDLGILGEDPYKTLQDMGVLSRVEHRLLQGVEIRDLDNAELSFLNQFGRLPTSAASRIGLIPERNRIILESVGELDPTWPILLFALSVDHAQTMAALLNAEQISAAAISSGTEHGARRHYIDKFRKGELRVLTNYGVLTAGFDAPATRAIYVTRPVFSPGLYQQMIGRGLRGPLNGGKDSCLIVNVNDNFLQYGEDLAFTKFEHLWNQKESKDEYK